MDDILENLTEDELYRATNTPSPTAGCLIVGSAALSSLCICLVLFLAVVR